ncbi:MAG TPA: GtrA family protein [Patescibacteria group bacterium]|nr:GtrA family protein [Patescibacteria group bacterium]
MLPERPALTALINRFPILRQLGPSFLRYLLVGGIGFLVDAGLLELFHYFGLSIYAARGLSMTLAIGITYWLHKNFTFTDSAAPAKTAAQAAAFVGCQLLAAAVNYGLFCVALALLPPMFLTRLLALCCGVGAGLVVNFVLLRFLVFPTGARGSAVPANPWRLYVWLAPLTWFVWQAVERSRVVLKWPDWKQPLGPHDPDVWLRLAQVRQWLIGHDFFSHAVRNTNAPFGGIDIHWTRPVDMLLVAGAFLTSPQLGGEIRLLLAASWLPPVLGMFALYFIVQAAQKHFNHIQVTLCAIGLLMFSPLLSYYMPGDADHHGLLAMLWCGAVCIAMQPLTTGKGALLGVVLGLMLWISPETLMPMAALYAVLGFFTLRDAGAIKPLAVAAWAAFALCALGLAVEMGPARYFAQLPLDTLSMPYVVLMFLVAIGASLLCLPQIRGRNWQARLICAVALAAAVAGVELWLYPDIAKGPLAAVDEFVHTNFLTVIIEAQPLLARAPDVIFRHLWQPLLAAGLLLRRPASREKHLLLALLASGVAMTLVQGRWTYYLQPPAIIALAALLPGYATAGLRQGQRFLRPLAVISVFGILVMAVSTFVAAAPDARAKCQQALRLALQTQRVQGDNILYVEPGVGGDALFFTTQRIIAGNYHREGEGLRALDKISNAPNAPTAKWLLDERKVEVVLACPGGGNKWLAEKPDWLAPLGDLGGGANLFVIRR